MSEKSTEAQFYADICFVYNNLMYINSDSKCTKLKHKRGIKPADQSEFNHEWKSFIFSCER